MESLISNLISKIKGSPEDFATESLCYLINKSKHAKTDFTELIYKLYSEESPEELFFETQVSGETNERPDLVGRNIKNEELIIGEFKFWATLTDNQPVQYLKRLDNSNYKGKKILFFVSPNKRIHTLWQELLRRCKDSEFKDYDLIKEKYICKWDSKNIALVLLEWNTIISNLEHTFVNLKNTHLHADLIQLKGLCDKMDEEAFLPLQANEIGLNTAKRICQFYNLLDKIGDKLKNELKFSTEGLKATPQYYGHTRYLKYQNIGIGLHLNFKFMYEKAETPFWIGFKQIENNWKYSPEIRNKLIEFENSETTKLFVEYDYIYLPLFIKYGSEENDVINNMIEQIKNIFIKIKEKINK